MGGGEFLTFIIFSSARKFLSDKIIRLPNDFYGLSVVLKGDFVVFFFALLLTQPDKIPVNIPFNLVTKGAPLLIENFENYEIFPNFQLIYEAKSHWKFS